MFFVTQPTKTFWSCKTQIICAYIQSTSRSLQVTQCLSTMSPILHHSPALAPHRKAYKNLVTNLRNEPAVPKATRATNPLPALNHTDYPKVTLWTKKAFGNCIKEEFEPDNITEGNVMFWFLEAADGTIVDGATVTRMRFASKVLWATMLCDYGTLGSLWTKLTPAQQMEFYLNIEDEFPFLRLCEDHYKAQKIGTLDYSHWYSVRSNAKPVKKCCPQSENDPESNKCKCKRRKRDPSASLSRRALLRSHRSESWSQIPVESSDHPPPPPSTLSPPPPRSDSPPAPGSSPVESTLTLDQTLSSTSPTPSTGTPASSSHLLSETQPGSPTVHATESDKSPSLCIGGSVTHSTSSDGLDIPLDSHLDAAPTRGCPPNRVVNFFSYSSFVRLTCHHYHLRISEAIPDPL
jgi:hypothetical protein